VAAREPRDAERFRALGVAGEAIRVTGNTKHDRAGGGPPALPWRGEPVWVVGSLRPGEETAILDAFDRVRRRTPLRLVVAPRHPGEWPQALSLLAARGLRVAVRSRPGPDDAQADVLWVDRLGELAALYRAATVAFVGGTLVPVGGHNVAEPAREGVPVLFGPHTENVRGDAEALLDLGGARRVADAAALAEALGAWLLAPEAREAAGRGAARAVAMLGGAAERTLEWLVQREVLRALG
jgi:3-deoxy-D-manno-octulosonic-acid transferase